jgi:5,5'-dehydrodivanillate O-demethylase
MQVTDDDLVRTGPGTIAGEYLRRFWQPVLRSEDLLANHAVPVRLMSEDFTLYRGEGGTPHLVAAYCPHRRTRLHVGVVERDEIACLYHGWRFDGTGQCVFQIGERPEFTRATKIATYPTEDYIGLIWAYVGPGAAPPLRRFPDFERPGLLSIGSPEIWPCNLWNRLDNGPDAMHVVFTHQESLARDMGGAVTNGSKATQVPESREVHAVETDFGVETIVRRGANEFYNHFIMPNANAIAARTGRVESFNAERRHWCYEMFVRVPIDDENSASYHLSLIDLHGEEAAEYIAERDRGRAEFDPDSIVLAEAKAVVAGKKRIRDMDRRLTSYYSFLVEDYACQVGQGPIADRTNERLGANDQPVLLLRKIWKRELKALGEGQPLREWVVPAGLADRTEPQPSLVAKSAHVGTEVHA